VSQKRTIKLADHKMSMDVMQNFSDLAGMMDRLGIG
jgi:hypothetical protein